MKLCRDIVQKTVVTVVLTIGVSCDFGGVTTQTNQRFDKDLYAGFQHPPAEARPFVRWWWNGNKVKKEELNKQLASLQSVGFGGVEINPIAMPIAPPTPDKSLVWMSDEWIDMVVHACKKTQDLGMIADMIAGTGWPFGGEFLTQDETCQRIVTDVIPYSGGDVIRVNEKELIACYKRKHKKNRVERHNSSRTKFSLASISLVPTNCSSVDEIIALNKFIDASGNFQFSVPQNVDSFYLSYQLLQQDFRDVTLGAPGGAGPVMDHYKKETTLAYLNRMKKISERSGVPLGDLIRALFCDSIEVSGANWSDGFSALFFNAYGYSLDPWMPFVFYQEHKDYAKSTYTTHFSEDFKRQLKRVRFDYNKLLVETFLDNFTKTYKTFCEENGILCRYQAYGTPFLMGMLDGYMLADIPESNNWMYVAEMKDETFRWSQHRGDKIWNLYASSAAHLTGKKITSCEAMTNTSGVFKTTLEEIKQHDDMNFITGINHTVLHGYNYSPEDVPFPGWIRYGAYFSEQNPWWKHLRHWVDYNARLSYVFQNSQPKKSIAILGPTADVWGDKGLAREPFHMEPKYLYKLWEPISQLGYSCDYINQNVLATSTVSDGVISFGDMHFEVLVLASIKSIDTAALKPLNEFVASGGKLIVVDGFPNEATGFKDFQANDATVVDTMNHIQEYYTSSVVQVKQPKSLSSLLDWTKDVLDRTALLPDVDISNPNENVFQIHQSTPDKELYFFTNVNRKKTFRIDAKFPVKDKYPYKWNPETGERTPFSFASYANELEITLEPLTSLLLVFEAEKPSRNAKNTNPVLTRSTVIESDWNVLGNRIDGTRFIWDIAQLSDFGASKDDTQKSFAGELIYKTQIDITDNYTHLDLGEVNEGITTLYINGKKVGKRWYGKAIYPVGDVLKLGKNEIEIRYTTVLANYCMSIDNNMVNRWTRSYKKNGKIPMGIEGPVKLVRLKL